MKHVKIYDLTLSTGTPSTACDAPQLTLLTRVPHPPCSGHLFGQIRIVINQHTKAGSTRSTLGLAVATS
jgi:hypothetical protein